MPWIIGIDEAGYGPNLGPFVMTAVACRVPDDLAGANLWHVLAAAVRQDATPTTAASLVDDSKLVYSTGARPARTGARRPGDAVARPSRTFANAAHLSSTASCARRPGRPARRSLVHRRPEPAGAGRRRTVGRRPRGASTEACGGVGCLHSAGPSVVMCRRRASTPCSTRGDSKGAVLAHALRPAAASARDSTRRRAAVLLRRQARRPQHLRGADPARPAGGHRRRCGRKGMHRSVYRVAGPEPGGAADVSAAGRRRAFLRGAGVDGEQVPARAVDGRSSIVSGDARARPEADGRLSRRRGAVHGRDPFGGAGTGNRGGSDLATG